MSIESRISGRERAGKILTIKDVIENEDYASKIIEENKDRGKIFVANHFSLFDGPSLVGNLFRFEQLRDVDMGVPVTDYLYKYAKWIDKTMGLELQLTSVVTPASVERGKVGEDRRGEGLKEHMRLSMEILKNKGAEVLFPQASRAKDGHLGEPSLKNRAMEGLLRLNEKLDPVVIPIGIYTKGIPPKYLYWGNPFPYRLKFGEPKTTQEIKEMSYKYVEENLLSNNEGVDEIKPFTGADAVVYGMIRALLPDNYK